ncbi:MAG: hypothetical protein DRJ34_00445 [Thermoprotei archaeon]|nr:MAG: hypothetical protein DRJ34_00445 [Thermoprotei archaeon]
MLTVVIVLSPKRKRLHKILLESLKMNTNRVKEIILITLGYDDIGYLDYQIDSLNNKGIRTVILSEDSKKSLAECRNRGCELATQEYVAFLDDDVIVTKLWERNILSNKKYDLVFGSVILHPIYYKYIRHGREMIYATASVFNNLLISRNKCIKSDCVYIFSPKTKSDMILCTRGLWGANFMVRKSILKRIGMFDCRLGYRKGGVLGGEDTDIVLRAFKKGIKVCFAEKAVVYHIVDPTKLSIRYALQKYATIPHAGIYYQLKHKIHIITYLISLLNVLVDKKLTLINKIDIISLALLGAFIGIILRILTQFDILSR